LPTIEAMLMILPERRSIMCSTTARQHRNTPLTLTSCTRVHSRSSSSWNGTLRDTPALLTRTSTWPCSASTPATTSWHDAQLVTS
jgi:hypothetical protein